MPWVSGSLFLSSWSPLGMQVLPKSISSFRADLNDQMLDTILLKRFEKRSGHRKVLRGEYVIEEGITGREMSRENELIMCLRPGQKIDMSMIFSDLDGNSNRCPRVNTSCQMWFQRLVVIDEFRPEPIPSPMVMVSEEPVATSSSSRTKGPQVPVVTPADFQRVRLMSTLRKTVEREQIGGAYSGPSTGWALVDVSTLVFRRVPYNEVRTLQRSRSVSSGIWTEITKDVVVRDAIEELGYYFEETEFFYFIIGCLQYEDVEELVALSESIRHKHRDVDYRIKAIIEYDEQKKEILFKENYPTKVLMSF
ncbi:conserved glutamic acid rich protein [Rutstroemia sp. NJR-2017a WRK4]|nr:conserved glutamic acid rich protein [Rutstroemia sp. NJR-2017a WRK4]